jgi:phosphopantothenate-cysteine ligase
MTVLITAGGTTERIDSVRGITNSATGRLGSLVAEQFDERAEVGRVIYVCSPTAVRPNADKTEIVTVTYTAELETAVREILSREQVDIIVHSMAVSDYRVRAVTTVSRLAAAVGAALTSGADVSELERVIGSSEGLNRREKLSSYERDLIVALEPTPKIIALFKELAPSAVLFGFKLLAGASYDTLIAAASELMRKNACSFVLANDAREISGDRHAGYLISRSGEVRRFETKLEIARGIVASALGT